MSWSELRSLAKKTNGVASPQGDSLIADRGRPAGEKTRRNIRKLCTGFGVVDAWCKKNSSLLV